MSCHLDRQPHSFASPKFFRGTVVKGYGRGSRDLGCPTANISGSFLESLNTETGIYFGWTQFRGQFYRSAISIGWNPTYGNDRLSFEVHLIDYHGEDFYGDELVTALIGSIRGEKKFSSLDELMEAIRSDIQVTKASLTDDPSQLNWNFDE